MRIVEARIEIPMGSQNKYEVDEKTGKIKLDRDDGRWVYELELRNGRTEYECDINAVTGVILDWESDYDD